MYKLGVDYGVSSIFVFFIVDGNNVLFIFFYLFFNIGIKINYFFKKSVNILNVYFLGKENLIGYKNLLRNIL